MVKARDGRVQFAVRRCLPPKLVSLSERSLPAELPLVSLVRYAIRRPI